MSGRNNFLEYYRSLCSIAVLRYQPPPVLRFAQANVAQVQKLWQQADLPWQMLDWYPYAVLWPVTVPLGTTLPGYDEGLIYPMNASSLLPVLTLNPQPGETILDACAAPGGKAIFIGQLLQGSGQLYVNDTSAARQHRLAEVLQHYHITATRLHYKAETMFRRWPNYFDKILLDAPCSSEKHVFQHPAELQRWSKARIRSLQFRQKALLSGLTLALKPGGQLVYSTCAITPEENETVVEIILKKRPELELIPAPKLGPAEAGRIWPDLTIYDPMFVACFRKH